MVRLLVTLGLLALLAAPTARADAFEDAVRALNADSYDAKVAAVDALAALRDERAIPVLSAMEEGDLYVRESDGLLVIGQKEGRDYRLTGALDGQDQGIASSRELDKVMVNNRVRGAIKAAVGRLQLENLDPQRRLAAVDNVLRERSPEAAELLRAALEAEIDTGVRVAMEFGVAAMDLAGDDPERRLAAIALLTGSLDPRARALLGQVAADPDASPEVKQPPKRRSPRSRPTGVCSSWSPTSIKASRSGRSCCLPRSGSRSPSA
jgi:urea transport system permease protein